MSNYMKFSEFNNLDEKPQQPSIPNDDLPSDTQPKRLPIRQHMPYPRNPPISEPYLYSPPPQQKLWHAPMYYPSHMIPEYYHREKPMMENFGHTKINSTPVIENYNKKNVQPEPSTKCVVSCIDIHGHITECPVCSNCYKSYNNIWIGVVVFLCLVILLLLKKIYEK